MLKSKSYASTDMVSCVDLFCGVGGLTHGLILEGIPVLAGVDVESSCKVPYEHNNMAKFIHADISNLASQTLVELYGKSEVRVLAGCAPCQPFSNYSNRYETIQNPRWSLLYQFARLISDLQPEIVTMENVPQVCKHKVYSDFIESLKCQGYNVTSKIVDCTQYGLPQTRKRMVVLASRIGDIDIIDTAVREPNTVRAAIGHLPPIINGQSDPYDVLHVSSKLSDINYERILAAKPGGTWRDWPSHLVAPCHRKESGKTYSGVYGRMTWDQPAPTITTQFFGFGNGRFGHPEQNRAISLREGAILQGFPMSYEFVGAGVPVHFKALGRMIGNAVPVTLGRVIGASIRQHLEHFALTNKFVSKGPSILVA